MVPILHFLRLTARRGMAGEVVRGPSGLFGLMVGGQPPLERRIRERTRCSTACLKRSSGPANGRAQYGYPYAVGVKRAGGHVGEGSGEEVVDMCLDDGMMAVVATGSVLLVGTAVRSRTRRMSSRAVRAPITLEGDSRRRRPVDHHVRGGAALAALTASVCPCWPRPDGPGASGPQQDPTDHRGRPS